LHIGPLTGATMFWHGTLISGRPMGILLALLFGLIVTLVATNRTLHLYSPTRLGSILHEQRRSAQACLTSGLLLTGTLYLVHADDFPRRIVLVTLGLVIASLGVRRLAGRFFLHRRFKRGIGTRKVLIVGTEPVAHALRYHLETTAHLGYTVKGLVELPDSAFSMTEASIESTSEFEAIFQQARRQFVDEIFLTSPCDRSIMTTVLEQAHTHAIDVRVAPDTYSDMGWSGSIESIDQLPTLLFHSRSVSGIGLAFKRLFDVVFSCCALIAVSPLLLAIAAAIKFDSPGPVFYFSERLGKRGRIFRCTKFRTMVADAELLRAQIEHLNERDGVLFKVANDPRITRLGRFLRKYSLDELPQFFNVLRGEMSIVGPRPPLAEEVMEYELEHLRRLDVMPGITGLWQVQA
jgi:exopolysaccharide biosynthesis polyprenyl glycosylphosphotransferase